MCTQQNLVSAVPLETGQILVLAHYTMASNYIIKFKYNSVVQIGKKFQKLNFVIKKKTAV